MATTDKTLRGYLRDTALTEIIATITDESRSGMLALVGGPLTGIIYFSDGVAYEARILHRRQKIAVCTGEEALHQMISWCDAEFIFRRGQPLVHTQALVHPAHPSAGAAACSPNQPQHGAETLVPRRQTRVVPTHKPVKSDMLHRLDADHWALLQQFDQHHTALSVGQLADIGCLSEQHALRLVVELLSLGILEPALHQPILPTAMIGYGTTARVYS